MKPRKARRVVPESKYLRVANGIQRLLSDCIVIRADLCALNDAVQAQRRALGALTMKLGELGWTNTHADGPGAAQQAHHAAALKNPLAEPPF